MVLSDSADGDITASGSAASDSADGDITATSEWAALARHARELQAGGVDLAGLFEADPGRAGRCTSTAGELVVDWSRHLVTDATVELLLALAERAGVAARIEAMLAGEPVNVTDGRAALHTALRAPAGEAVVTGGVDVAPAVAAERERMGAFVRALVAGERRGAGGLPIRTVVNIGIGGSQLGPAMAHEALAAFRSCDLECRFVSNIDPAALAAGLDGLDAAETLFIVVSKGFATAETLANARAARAWAASVLGLEAAGRHFVAVTASREAAVEFGIEPDDVFATWDWVGGRFSMGSAAGLAVMAAIGEENFAAMLAGMRSIDEHVAGGPAASVPMLLGLLSVWYRNFWGFQTRAVVPYSERLRLFGVWLQQVIMESNGKRVRLDGSPVGCETAEIVWGGPGTDSQHSFHQLLHQGTTVVPADFIVLARPDADVAGLAGAAERHEALVANCFAQAAALAFGTPPAEEDDPHRELPGNRPSTVILAPELTPSVLGQLVALYEHQTVVQGAVWGINSFDQFGVELGKTLADAITADLRAGTDPAGSDAADADHDPSTKSLLAHYRRLRKL
ncbi:MAG: glucose-6-phosphate isomerase [Acidimicrobiaceae bacterium]|nr:glucose-6-phosphate isomerase [Acidimicrobiaceae bacterium]